MSNIPSTPADGNVKTVLVTTMANIGAPATSSEINAASTKDISCYLVPGGFSIQVTQDAITDDRECDTFVAEQAGRKKISGSTITAIDNSGTALDPASNVAAVILTEGTTLYAVRRYGLPFSTAFAAAQKVDVFKVVVGAKQRQTPEANSVLRSVWPLFVQDYRLDVATVA